MRIIKEGNITYTTLTCQCCGCVMEVTVKDTYIGPFGRYLRCPCCDAVINTGYFNELDKTNAYPVKEEN